MKDNLFTNNIVSKDTFFEKENKIGWLKQVGKHVALNTLKKQQQQNKETGSLEKKEVHRSFRKIDLEKLRAYVAEHPDVYQSEILF